MKQQPPTPQWTIDEGATGLHEIYQSYVRAGFTEEQAMDLLKHSLRVNHECPNHGE
jgi:hypothetical protein